MKPLRYFFWRVYEWKQRSEPEPRALFSALAATSVTVFLNGFALWIVLDETVGLGVPHHRDTARAVAMVIGLLIMAVLYRALIGNHQYVKFAEEFQTETDRERRLRTVAVIFYAVASLVMPMTLAILLIDRPAPAQ